MYKGSHHAVWLRREFTAEAHDAESLLFKFLDELLFTFLTELFVCTSLTVTRLDRQAWTITAKGCVAAA